MKKEIQILAWLAACGAVVTVIAIILLIASPLVFLFGACFQ